MHTMLSTTLPPALSVLVILGFAGLMFAMVLAGNLFARKMSGWKDILGRFPMTDIHDAGDIYSRKSGVFGNMSCSRGLTIRIAHEGVCIYPSFARRNPCLIPWSAIRRISVSDTSLLVVVDYERTFDFFLPAESLPIFQTRLSSELFHESVSPFEAAKKVIQGGTQPRWMSAIGGQAVRLAEKELEKEKQLRKGGHDDAV